MEPAPAKAGDCCCYLPLYIFCGRPLLVAKLRPANIDASAGAVEEVARVVAQIRARWPHTRILLRADSGFAREALMLWCEQNSVDYVFGLARNRRLTGEIEAELAAAETESLASGKPARRFKDFMWTTRDSWSRRRRVVAKAEWTGDAANPRFIVTSLKRSEAGARHLYEAVYCARGDMENRIKSLPPTRSGECQADLFADRTSARTMRANQLRLWFASLAGACTRESGCADVRAAPDRPRPHPVRRGDLRDDPPEAAQDRRAGAGLGAPRQGRHGLRLPLPARIRPRPRQTDRRRLTSPEQAHRPHTQPGPEAANGTPAPAAGRSLRCAAAARPTSQAKPNSAAPNRPLVRSPG